MNERVLATAPYVEQMKRWPKAGRHILAQFDDDTIIVYQASPLKVIYASAVPSVRLGAQRSYGELHGGRPGWCWERFSSDLWNKARCV